MDGKSPFAEWTSKMHNLLHDDLVRDLKQTLREAYGPEAPSEALIRALVAERTSNRKLALFWVEVFWALQATLPKK